ncbi:MAG: hypothetical protein EDM05_005880 [Leptolyngbya sp. IPPAS B-1204]|nr:hypothetical protein [Elainella sp. C42_A2020_010]RNJ69691.1 MAG: hypothetical protein EDM05_08925 [Leptolyngbya sp. IPPAS B-1204]
MDIDFAELELLAQQPLDVVEAEEWLASAAQLYENSPTHELFDRLESAVESYTLVRDHLATCLRESAEAEIAFFLSLLQERLNLLLEQPKPLLLEQSKPNDLPPDLQLQMQLQIQPA